MPTNVQTHVIDYKGIAGAIVVLSIAGLITLCLGFATPDWRVTGKVSENSYHQGLWKDCSCISKSDRQQGNKSRLTAIQIMTSIGLAFAAATTLAALLYTCLHGCCPKSTLLILFLIGAIVTVLFVIIGLALFVVDTKKVYGEDNLNLSWSFAFVAISACLFGILIVLSIVQYCRARN